MKYTVASLSAMMFGLGSFKVLFTQRHILLNFLKTFAVAVGHGKGTGMTIPFLLLSGCCR